jgi:uncharacterized protein (DUF2336 family)
MVPHATLFPELELAIQHGSAEKRVDMAERVTALFIDAADRSDTEQIALFDQVLVRLVDEIESPARAGISRQLAPVERAPAGVVRRLAGDGDIDVAGPVLRHSPRLEDSDLAAIASRMGPSHLLAIAQRPAVAAPVTDILVERGDTGVLQAVAANRRAEFSDLGFGTLVKRAADDDALAETVGRRPDIPVWHLRRLVNESAEVVRRRLMVPPPTQGESGEALAKVSTEMAVRAAGAYREAQRTVMELVRTDKLDEAALLAFAKSARFEETVAALSALSRMPIEAVERLIRGERLDAMLILGRAIGIEWTTARAIIALRSAATSGPSLDDAKANFDRLARQGAQRVVRFWRSRAGKHGQA